MKIVSRVRAATQMVPGGGGQVVQMRPSVAVGADPRVEQLVAKVVDLEKNLTSVVKAHNATVEELTKLKAAHNGLARGASSLAKHFQGFAAASQIQYTPAVVQRPAAQPRATAQAPAAQAGPPPASQTVVNATPVQPAASARRQAQNDAVFYGPGEEAFFQGGENDE